MKRVAIAVFIALALSSLIANPLLADKKDDFQVIKKAVKENPNYEQGKEAKWFKVLVTDAKTNKDKVRVTLPISLVEVFLKCSEDKHFRLHDKMCNVDLKELFAELKKLGPMVLIEVFDEEEIVKVWLE
jgi:uncharacterized protein YdeI (BOF family)